MLNIGLAGLGWWGKHMTHTLKESKKLNLVRAAEVKIEGVRDFITENDLVASDNFDDLLTDSNVDAVILATPHSLHEEQITKVAAAGKHVLKKGKSPAPVRVSRSANVSTRSPRIVQHMHPLCITTISSSSNEVSTNK